MQLSGRWKSRRSWSKRNTQIIILWERKLRIKPNTPFVNYYFMSRERDFYRKMEQDVVSCTSQRLLTSPSRQNSKTQLPFSSRLTGCRNCGLYDFHGSPFICCEWEPNWGATWTGCEPRSLQFGKRHQTQNTEIQQLKAENKKIYNHINSGLHRTQTPPGIKETWDIPFYGTPKYERRSFDFTQEAELCLPFLE